MPNKFVLASAGAGKTTTMVTEALDAVRNTQSVLFLTYTRNNQAEIIKKIKEVNGTIPQKLKIKGWFSFLLEDLIRPYQRCLFSERISNIVFDQNAPHKRDGRTIPGRSETNNRQRYYLSNYKVHTTYISKLVTRICDLGKTGRGRTATYEAIERLASVYDLIVIDEIQDLVGWDYSVLDYILSNQQISLYCVGDFRQTIYQTSHASKHPQTSDQKRQWFTNKGFECQNLNHSWRCVQQICAFADAVHMHQGYEATNSKIEVVSEEFDKHVGVFSVSNENVGAYLNQYLPIVLRHAKNVRNDLCQKTFSQNFGEAKGLGFNRVLIIPTENYMNFLQGDPESLRTARTEEALNKLYVAITRARYSVAFLSDAIPTIDGISEWTPEPVYI
ncbi:MAG: UvrD-helicase domain-containing protein [Methylocystaceae bacterium]|nr:UvrD-helicase domain-containing protein [Methylocystaceae bacterium]